MLYGGAGNVYGGAERTTLGMKMLYGNFAGTTLVVAL